MAGEGKGGREGNGWEEEGRRREEEVALLME